MSTTSPSAAAEKFKPTQPIVFVVPSKSAGELKLRESLSVLKVALAMKLKGVESDMVTLSECKNQKNSEFILTISSNL